MSAANYDLKSVVSQSQIARCTELIVAQFLYSRPMNYILFLLGLSACAIASAIQIKSLPSLHTQGEDYDNACVKKELIRLHEDVVRGAENRNPDDAWQITKVLLCGVDGTAAATINRHSPKKILFTSQNARSEVAKELREPDDDLLAAQKAWAASMTNDATSNLVLTYMVNEGCTRRVVLRFNGKRWLIVEFGYACEFDFIDGVSKGC